METKSNKYGYTVRFNGELPVEKTIYYIVRDYNRMYNCFHEFKERAEKAERKAESLAEKNGMLQKDIEAARRSFEQIKEGRKGKRLEELERRVEELKSSRDAIVREVTADLEEQLEEKTRLLNEARQQIKTLASIVADPSGSANVTIDLSHTLRSDDEMDWLDKSTEHIETALQRLEQAKERLDEYYDTINDGIEKYGEYSSFSNAIKKIGRAFDRIDSACSHIEHFLEVVGDVKIDRNDG